MNQTTYFLYFLISLQFTEELASQFWIEEDLASRHSPERVKDLFGPRILQQIADSPSLEGSKNQVRIIITRKHDHLRARPLFPHDDGGTDAIPLRHLNVHENNVRRRLREHHFQLIRAL